MASLHPLRIDIDRLVARLQTLGQVGALPGGGVKRLALSDADKAGRDLVTGWMRELGLTVSIDQIGNVWGVRSGAEDLPPVMTGSHIDTVATGGLYDGNLGVLAGLEVVQCLSDAGIQTRHPLAVAFFTNEEGARFAPDMMGSGVHQGALELAAMLDVTDADGKRVGDELARIGYVGSAAPMAMQPASFFELHIEQGPVLEEADIEIGAVTGVQGISWSEFTITGVSNHAGTTPMRLRHDAALVASRLAVLARQIATAGFIRLTPNLVNVVAREAIITIDLRHTDEASLQQAEQRMFTAAAEFAAEEGCTIARRTLARFEPVAFDPALIDAVDDTARQLGLSVMRMPSGAGHDAQMFAPRCPTGMIFVPSHKGLSHNINEHTDRQYLESGANVLLQLLLQHAGVSN